MAETLNRSTIREIIEKSLEKKEGCKINVCGEPDITTLVSGGLLSSTARVKTKYTINGRREILYKTFFFKMPPKSGTQAKLVHDRRMFEKEALYYGRVLPMMLDLIPKKLTVPLPQCYFIESNGDNKCLVLDDLSEDGYRSPDPSMLSEGLDLRHCLLAMRSLGRLHGLSVAVEMSLPGRNNWLENFQDFAKESWFYEAREEEMVCPAVKLTEKAMENLVELSRSVEVPPVKEIDSDKMKKIVKNTWKVCCQMVARDDKINVPSHGDFYANNLMFKYGTDRFGVEIPVDVKVIDLQLARYCHPAIDILFFLHLCTRKSLREVNMENLLGVYYESLEVTLKYSNIRSPPFTLEELTRDVCGKYKPFGVLVGAVSVPNLILASDGLVMETKDFQDIFEGTCDDKVKMKLVDDPWFRLRMIELLRDVADIVNSEIFDGTQ